MDANDPDALVSTAAANLRGVDLHREHIVPSRVLVDRMIMNPGECLELLDTAVIIASVTPEEHRKLGGIFTHFEELYGRMLKASVSELPSLGMERSAASCTMRSTVIVRRTANDHF